MKWRSRMTCLAAILLLATGGLARAQSGASSPVLQAMKDELARSLQTLKNQPSPPYFLSYEVTETQTVVVTGTFGTLTGSSESRHRQLDIDLRVGDYSLDNSHPLRGGFPGFDFFDRFMSIEMPIEDDVAAIRSILWYYTDKKYKRAVEQLTKVKTNVQVKVEQEDRSADFSKEPPERYFENPASVSVDRRVWEEKIKRYAAPFAKYDNIYAADAFFSVTGETRWYGTAKEPKFRARSRTTACSSLPSPKQMTAWNCRDMNRSSPSPRRACPTMRPCLRQSRR